MKHMMQLRSRLLRPNKGPAKFRMDTRYPHRRSEGMSHRTNRGTQYLESVKPSDPCPECGEADLEQHGGKKVCPVCHYIQPCCQP
jgi:hypothetical protein